MTSPLPKPQAQSCNDSQSTSSASQRACATLLALSRRFEALNESISRLLWRARLTNSPTPLGISPPPFALSLAE